MWQCEPVECDAVMIAKIARLLRTPAHGKIGRAGADDAADRTDAGRNHAAVRQGADPDCEIDPSSSKLRILSLRRSRRSMSGYATRNSSTTGSRWRCPRTVGAVTVRSPL